MKKRTWIPILIVCLGVIVYLVFHPQILPLHWSDKEENHAENEDTQQLNVWVPATGYQNKGSLSIHKQYYYSVLPQEEQQLYGEIYTAMKDHSDFVEVSITEQKTIEEIMQYVLLDNPELYYVDTLQMESTSHNGKKNVKVKALELMTEREQVAADDLILRWGNECIGGMSGMSIYGKAVHIYEYVITHVDYMQGAPYNQSLYSAVLGKSVCKGYACAFKYLCDKAGIPCLIVSGALEGRSHAWNMVFIDGTWSHVDCTAGDDIAHSAIPVDYSWFGLTDEQISASHTIADTTYIPKADSETNNYYMRNGAYDYFADEENLCRNIEKGVDFSFQCANAGVYEQYKDLLRSSAKVGSAAGGRSLYYMGNDATRTIYILFEGD